MLWTRSQVETFIGICIPAIARIIWIKIIGNGMKYIDIDTACRINYLNKSIEPYPRIVVDVDAKILVDCGLAQGRPSIEVDLVQLHHAFATCCVKPGITRYWEHAHALRGWINGNNDICLSQVTTLKFFVCIAAQQENIDTSTTQNVTCTHCVTHLIRVIIALDACYRLTCNVTYWSRKVSVVVITRTCH